MLTEDELYRAIWGRSELLFTESELQKVKDAVVGVAGIGGGGCVATEMLARLGVGTLRLADPDHFEATNLNRQLFATMATLGRSKAETAANRVREINPYCKVETFADGVTKANTMRFVDGLTVALSQVDVLGPDVVLHRAASRLKVPVVKGSRSGYPGHRWEVKAFVWDYRKEPRPRTPEEVNELSTLGLSWDELTDQDLRRVDSEVHERMRERLNARVATGNADIFRPAGSSGEYLGRFKGSPDNIFRTICAPIANAAGLLAAVEALKVILGWENSRGTVHLLA